MRTLVINKQNLFYALFVGREPAVDSNGRKTGEYVKTYSSPTQISMNGSPARGIAEHDMFGVELDYDRSMVTDDLDCPIDEHSAVWIFDNPRVAATAEVTLQPHLGTLMPGGLVDGIHIAVTLSAAILITAHRHAVVGIQGVDAVTLEDDILNTSQH